MRPIVRLPDRGLPSIFLVSCVKTKGSAPAKAKDLYISSWFRKARAFVEETGAPWRILSAQYGLVHPEEVIAPYEKTLLRMGVAERREWACGVLAALCSRLDPVQTVIFLAGARYREFLENPLRARGVSVSVPMAGLSSGRQLSWLTRASRRASEP